MSLSPTRAGQPHLAGSLLLLIALTTNDGDDNLSSLSRLPVNDNNDKGGMALHLAALAALTGVDALFFVGVA